MQINNKNEKISFLIIISFIFFPNILINLFKSYECSSDFFDCFNCSTCRNEYNNLNDCICEWNSNINKCDAINEKKEVSYFYETFSFCNDSKSNSIQNIYCGESFLKIDNEFNFVMPKVNEKYGTESIYCNYKFLLSEKDDIDYNIYYVYNSEYNNNINDILLILIIEYNNQTTSLVQLDNNTKNFNIQKVKNIEFKLYFKSSFISLPFNLKIKKESSFSSDNTFIIIIIVIILTIVLFFIGLYFLTKKLKQKIKERHHIIFENAIAIRYGEGIDDREVQKKKKLEKKYKLKIESFMSQSTITKSIIRKIKKDYECSICTEKFNEFNKVSITPCKHFFHYNCLSNWLFKNIMDPRCPNCNANIFEEIKKDGIYITNAIKNVDNEIINVENKIKSKSVQEVEIESNSDNNNYGFNAVYKYHYNKRKNIVTPIQIQSGNETRHLGYSITQSEN